MKLSEKQLADFWSKVAPADERGCRDWQSHVDKNGYGKYNPIIDGKLRYFRAHRVAYMLANDCELHRETILLHSCDRPVCCSLGHLRPGTHKENAADRDTRGRAQDNKGVKHPNARLTEEDARRIKYNVNGLTFTELAIAHGVSETMVRRIQNGERWKHV